MPSEIPVRSQIAATLVLVAVVALAGWFFVALSRMPKTTCNRELTEEEIEEQRSVAIEAHRDRILSSMNREGTIRFGPKQTNAFAEGSDAWCALNAGRNIELSPGGWILDIWDVDGKHYDGLGRCYPFTIVREWRESWAESNTPSTAR